METLTFISTIVCVQTMQYALLLRCPAGLELATSTAHGAPGVIFYS